jgi:hypothetical protein
MSNETKESQALEVARPKLGLMRPIASPEDVISSHREASDMIKRALEVNRDYGAIPGTRQDKKTLLKPGAERLCIAFGLRPRFTIVQSEIDHNRYNEYVKYSKKQESYGLYRFVVKCELLMGEDVRGEGMGSCSSLESKYIDRPRDCENTIVKMAKKRAFVDAVLITLALSDRFSQDVGDEEIDNEPDEPIRSPPVERVKKPGLTQEDIKERIRAALDDLQLKDEARNQAVFRILRRKPTSIADLETVMMTLETESARKRLAEIQATSTQDPQEIEGEVVDQEGEEQ